MNASPPLPRGLRCPACHVVISFTAPASDRHEGRFVPGLFCVCTRCGSTLVATPGPGLCVATADEVDLFYRNEPIEARIAAAMRRDGERLDVRLEVICRQIGWPTTRANIERLAQIVTRLLRANYPAAEIRVVET